MSKWEVIQGDCLDVMRGMADNSVSLVLTDPPYFRVKNLDWDRQWDKPEGFINWIGELCKEWHRILKPNGSLYVFASPKMAARVEVKVSEYLNPLNRIRWRKEAGWHNKAEKEALRSYLSPWEEIIFAEHYGADNIAKGEAGYEAKCDELRGFVFEPIRAYLDEERQKAGLTPEQVNVLCGYREQGGMAGRHYFSRSQFCPPVEAAYGKLQSTGFFQRPYSSIREQYETLREQYETLRRPFSVTADVHYTDVWDFPTVQPYPGKHVCEKPISMLRHIIEASSREGDTVLDCFAGSASTGEACILTGRNFIGIEKGEMWAVKGRHRLENVRAIEQGALFEAVA